MEFVQAVFIKLIAERKGGEQKKKEEVASTVMMR